MKNIKDLLLKYANFGIKEEEQKEKIIKTLNYFKITVDNKEIEIKGKILYLKINGPRKTEIILNKKNIIEAMNGEILDIN